MADRTDPRAARHARSRSKILEEAWVLARRHGLGRLSLGELARSVGLRQPSLCTYFDSKAGLYDAMFAQGNEQLWEEVASYSYSDDPKEAVKDFTRAVVAFCAADPTRFQPVVSESDPRL